MSLTDSPETLADIVEILEQQGDASAMIALTEDGRHVWSGRSMADRSRSVAYGLRAAGLEKGDRVALLAESRPEWSIAALATSAAGGIVVPLDAQFPDDVLRTVLEDCTPRFLFTVGDQVHRDVVTHTIDRLGVQVLQFDAPDPQREGTASWTRLFREPNGEQRELPQPAPDDFAVLFYTSGTTGPPKGVPLTHRNLNVQLRAIRDADVIHSSDRALLPLPLHHVYPFVIGMLVPLSRGVPVILPQSLTGPEIRRAFCDEAVTAVVGVPRLYAALFEQLGSSGGSSKGLQQRMLRGGLKLCAAIRRHLGLRPGRVLLQPIRRKLAPHLRLLTSGGAPLDSQLAWQLSALGWDVAIGYGLTETSPLLTINARGSSPLDSVGRPIREVEIRLEQPESDSSADDEPQAEPRRADSKNTGSADGRQSGEIVARGPGVFREYWNRPEKAAAAFTHDGWFRTGDLGEWDQKGNLYVTGRASTMIVTEAGENIQPDTVEEVYTRASAIREIGILKDQQELVAVVCPDEGRIRELGYGEPGGESRITQAVHEAVEAQSRTLPSYQRIADFVISRQSLPRTRLGKLRRHKLRERYEQLKQGREEASEAHPVPIEEMTTEDRRLLEHPAARAVWELLAKRYPDRSLTPDSSPQLDLAIDSMEWLNLTLSLSETSGVQIGDETIARIGSIRDLLREVQEHSQERRAEDILEHPEQVLSERHRRYVEPLGPIARLITRCGHGVNRLLIRSLFRVRSHGQEHLPDSGPFVIAANHASLLDPFLLGSVLRGERLSETYWAGWTGLAFSNRLARGFSRLARIIPIDPRRGPVTSLAVAATVLKRDKNLVWFPEGERSWDGQLQTLRPGLGLLLDRIAVPVIPTWIHGSHDALPRGQRVPRLRPIDITFGQPILPDELAERGEGDERHLSIVDALHTRIEALQQGGR